MRLFFCSIFILLIPCLQGCGEKQQVNQLQNVKKTGVLKVGTLFGSNNYFIGAHGPSGYEYELFSEFADSLGVKLQVHATYDIQSLFTLLDSGEVDLLGANLTATSFRKNTYRFSPAYLTSGQKLVFLQGREMPRDLAGLGDELWVVKSSSHEERLQFLQRSNPEISWYSTEDHDTEELIDMVATGHLAYTIVDSITLDLYRRKNPEISVALTVEDPQPLGWMFTQSNDDSLYAYSVEFFGNLNDSGRLEQLNEQYFGHVRSFDYVDTRLFIKAVDEVLPKYRELFIKYAGELDWRLLAAISYQESHWDPRAKSPTGVRGMMMLTLPTAKSMGVKSRLSAEQSIRGGSRYLSQLIDMIPNRIQEPDRTWFALAAYNIGWGHVEDARILTQKSGADPDKWVEVKQFLPKLRSKKVYKKTRYGFARGDEAVHYVSNIRRYLDTLLWLENQNVRSKVDKEELTD